MRSNLITGATFVAGAFAATLVFAQPPQGGQRPEGRGRFTPLILEALDADKDGALSADEIAKSSETIKTLDKDGDGKVSAEELRRPRPEGSGDGAGRPGAGAPGGQGNRGRFVFPVVAAVDTDKDGALSADEIAKAPEGLKTLDKHGDGKVSSEEMRPQRPEGGRGPQGDRN